MKKILMLGTGGTIACKRGESGLKPLISSEELLSYVPDAKQFCQADSIQILKYRQHQYAAKTLAHHGRDHRGAL